MICFRYLFTNTFFPTGQWSSFEMSAISFVLSLFSLPHWADRLRLAQSSSVFGSTATGRTTPIPFHIWLSFGDWLAGVVKGGERLSLGFSWWIQELGSGTRSLDSAESSHLDLVDRPMGKDCRLDSWWSYADARGYINKVKSVWRGVFEIPCFVFNYGIPGSCLA